MIFTTVTAGLVEEYEVIRNLSEEASKSDPENEPYRSKYLAKAKLVVLQSQIVNNSAEYELDEQSLKLLQAGVSFMMGVISMDTEEPSQAERELSYALDLLQTCLETQFPKTIISLLKVLNQLGILWSERSELVKCKGYLEEAKAAYEQYKSLDLVPCPWSIKDLFYSAVQNEEDNFKSLELIHTLTLYYLAQVYGNLGSNSKSASYCHTTLQRQLEAGLQDPIDWALNAATLSQYFAAREGYKDARHHLAAANVILGRQEAFLKSDESMEAEEREAKWETLRHRTADVKRCWSRYILLLMQSSSERLQTQATKEKGSEDERSAENLAAKEIDDGVRIANLRFEVLEPSVSTVEEEVQCEFAFTFEAARILFLYGQKCLNDAKTFYTLEDHASDYVKVIQDLSQLFKALIAFEPNEERKCRMHKRRIDMLKATTDALSPQHYLPEVRQLRFELAETTSSLMDLKLEKLSYLGSDPTPAVAHLIQKANHLTSESIDHFKAFLVTYNEDKTEKLPEVLAKENIRPVLIAHVHLGRLHCKLLTNDYDEKVQNLKTSVECYKYVADYCDEHEEAKPIMSEELGVCQEMVMLLPLRMEQASLVMRNT